jgi:predicted metalloendopeptidase
MLLNYQLQSKICITRVRAGLSLILDHFYVQRAFSAAAAATVEQIISNIKDVFVRRLKSLEWMDISVTKEAMDKILEVLPTVGYPPLVSYFIIKSTLRLRLDFRLTGSQMLNCGGY